MKSELKTEQFQSETLKRKIKLQQPSGKAAAAILDGRKEGKSSMYICGLACQKCVIEWQGEDVETILENIPADALLEIGDKITSMIGGDDSGNSEADQGDNSS